MNPNEIRSNIPYENPVQPRELTLESRFQFRCHNNIACFNACCQSIDITLTPYDILRLKRRLRMSSKEFVARYTVPFEMDAHGMPGLKMVTKPGTGSPASAPGAEPFRAGALQGWLRTGWRLVPAVQGPGPERCGRGLPGEKPAYAR